MILTNLILNTMKIKHINRILNGKTLGFTSAAFAFALNANAQAEVAVEEKSSGFVELVSSLSLEETILLILITFLILILFYFLSVVQTLIQVLIGEVAEKAKEKGIEFKPKKKSFFTQLMEKLTEAKTVEEAPELLIDHDYDGIQELDNSLPPWWKWMFYITIVWAFFYLVNYHVVPIWNEGKHQAALYDDEIEEGKRQLEEYKLKAADFVDETTVTMVTDAAVIAKGKAKFDEVCAACHGNQGQGEVGPNLTDEYWLHGGDIQSVFKIIKYGVPEKGMISWQDQLKPSEMQAVASYILTLQGTNPANPKEPQGELYKPETAPAEADSVIVE